MSQALSDRAGRQRDVGSVAGVTRFGRRSGHARLRVPIRPRQAEGWSSTLIQPGCRSSNAL